MKKFFTLIAAMILTASAAYSQSFVLIHTQADGTEVELAQGASYEVGYTTDEWGGVTTLEWNAALSLRFESVVAEFVYEINVEGAFGGFTGKTCPSFGSDCYPILVGMPNKYTISKRIEDGSVFDLDIEGSSMEAPTTPATLNIRVFEPDFEDEAVSCKVIFAPSSAAGIALTGADNTAREEYFNLQGMKINAPAEGQIVIKRKGNEVSKTLVR